MECTRDDSPAAALANGRSSGTSLGFEIHSNSSYNLTMNRKAAEILEEARQLPPRDLEWLIQNLLGDEDSESEAGVYAAWSKEVGEPEPGYEERFRAGVQEALADTSSGIPHEEVVKEISALLRARRGAQRLKASA